MKQVFKRIFQILLGISLLLLISGVVITFFFSEKIEEKVVSKIQQQMTAELQLGDVTFSLYETFPSASVKITDLLAFEKEGFDNDTLFYAKITYIELNIFDIISNTIDIKKVIVAAGRINIKYDAENKPNFAIFKPSEENKNQITLNQIVILNTSVKCQENNIDIDWHTSKSLLMFKENNLSINAKLFSEQLEVNKRDYINKKDVQLHAMLSFKKDSIFIQQGSIIHIEEVEVELSGGIFCRNMLDLKFSCNTQKLANVIKHTPEHLKAIYSSFQANGELSCNGSINGLLSKKSNPLLNMNYHIENGHFTLKSRPFMLKYVSLDGKITNGEDRNFTTTKIEISQFDAETENGSIKGDFTIKNLNKYYLTANLSSTWDLSEVNHYFEDSPFFDLTGRFSATTNYKGNFSFNKKFEDYFINALHNSEINFLNVNFKYLDSPLNFNIYSANFSLNNDIMNIKNSSLNVSESDFTFTGEVESFIPYILQKTNKMYVRGSLISSKMLFNELMTIKDISKGESTSSLPKWISVDINSYVTDFIYDNFNASNLSGKIQYNNQVLRGVGLIANSLEGHLHAGFVLTEPTNNYLVLKADLEFDEINIRKSFESFQNFNQDFIHQNELNGVGTAELEIEAHWKPSFIFNNKKLKIKSHLVIEQGELINFKPLENLSSFVSLDDLGMSNSQLLKTLLKLKIKLLPFLLWK